MNKKNIINILFLIISFIIYFFLVIYNYNQYIYNMNYFKCIIYSLLVCLIIFLNGIIINKDKIYKINIILYIIWFLIILFSFTFIIGRSSFRIYNLRYHNLYYDIQYKLFYTITNQLKRASNLSILKNIFGNIFALIPLSFLLMIKNKKYKNVIKQTFIIIPTILFIEILQVFTNTGVFDVDDIFLNYLGVLIFIFLITRRNIIDKIINLFYTDYKLNIKTKNMLYYISIIIFIIYTIFLVI